jgi:hypothetical protein
MLLLEEEPDVSLKPGSAADPFVVCCTSDTALLPFEADFFGLAARVAVGVAVVLGIVAAVRVTLLFTVDLAGLAIAFDAVAADFDAGLRVLAGVLTAGCAFDAAVFAVLLVALLTPALFAADLVTVAFMLTLFG